MMKRKFLAVVLPIIGCATVVGSGFSAWYFGDTVTTGGSGSATINVEVTDEIKDPSGTLSVAPSKSTITNNTILILDQGGPKNDSPDSGIMFGDTVATETTATSENAETIVKNWGFTVKYDGTFGEGEEDDLTLGKLYDAGLRIRINLSIEIKGDLTKYITFQDSVPGVSVTPSDLTGTGNTVALTGTEAKISGDYIITDKQVNDSGLSTASWEFELGVDTLKNGDNYSNTLLKYRERVFTDGAYKGGKPGAKDEPAKMESDLTDDAENPSQIVFSVIAYIEDDPTK